jgi:hypothetical protein
VQWGNFTVDNEKRSGHEEIFGYLTTFVQLHLRHRLNDHGLGVQFPEKVHVFHITQTVHCHESYNGKGQLHAPFNIYIMMFNYNPTCFEPVTGSSSGMSKITIIHTIQQHKYNF